MRIATVQVAASICVPAGQQLDGAVLVEPTWARPGRHTMNEDFAREQDAAGMLEIESIDGAPALWSSCCSGGPHDHH